MHHGSLLDRAVWVPAFAGTTAWGSADSGVLHRHLLTQIRHRRLKPALAVRDLQRVEADLDHPERAEQHRRVDMAHMGDAEGLSGEIADAGAEHDAALLLAVALQDRRIMAVAHRHGGGGIGEN